MSEFDELHDKLNACDNINDAIDLVFEVFRSVRDERDALQRELVGLRHNKDLLYQVFVRDWSYPDLLFAAGAMKDIWMRKGSTGVPCVAEESAYRSLIVLEDALQDIDPFLKAST